MLVNITTILKISQVTDNYGKREEKKIKKHCEGEDGLIKEIVNFANTWINGNIIKHAVFWN